jgi:hypothetical protein
MNIKLFWTVFAAVLCAGVVFAIIMRLVNQPSQVAEKREIGFKAELERG